MDVQNPYSHDTANSNLLLQRHLQLDNPWKRQREDYKVVQHIEDPQCQEELVDVDTLAGGLAAELGPEEAKGLTGVGHCDPDDEGVYDRDEAGEQEGDFQRFFERGEDASVEEEDGDSGAGAACAVDEGVREEELYECWLVGVGCK